MDGKVAFTVPLAVADCVLILKSSEKFPFIVVEPLSVQPSFNAISKCELDNIEIDGLQ